MWIKNVRLEQGFHKEDGLVLSTNTELFDLFIEEGKIARIEKSGRAKEGIDGKGYLALPSLRDNHVHLDKGHFGGPWKAVVPMDSVEERIQEEEGFLKDFLAHTPERAQALIDLITGFGVTYMKVQVNIDPIIELENYRIIKDVLEKNRHKLDFDLVAFPQHGNLKTQSKGLLEEALKEGIEILGGLDPAKIDKDIEKSLKASFDLAEKYNKPLDFHLHSPGTLGIYEMERIFSYIEKYNKKGQVSISHGLSLGDISIEEGVAMAKKFKEYGIEINTTQPLDLQALPFMLYLKEGVQVNVVNDNINDHWLPFGTGDIIEKVNTACQIHNFTDEYSISRSFKMAAGGLTPLDDQGRQIWPKVGDDADILFIKGESSAHAIARILPERVVLFKGKIVHGEFAD
ncbi:MAG: amidohydrolase [Gallicola sp.]|nr:amidohydrolase [Gallicola sp.]